MYRHTVYAPFVHGGCGSGVCLLSYSFSITNSAVYLPMLRILHSLPRTHKLLLLPVATMVTVLGAQKLITTYHDLNQPHTPLESVLIPLPSDSAPGLPSLGQERARVCE